MAGACFRNRRTSIAMDILGKRWIGLVALVALSGCTAALRGFPERVAHPMVELESLRPYLSVAKVDEYLAATDPRTRLRLRNDIVEARIHATNLHFGLFEQELYRQGIGIGVGTDWVVLALGCVTATVGGEATKAALGAVSSGITGAKASFDRHAMFERSVPVIMAEMVASRKAALLALRTGLERGDSEYSLFQALGDLERYYRAGTVPGSLAEIAEDAGSKAASAEEGLREVLSGSFAEDLAGTRLYRYLGWDGEQKQFLNTDNVEKLKAWLGENDLKSVFIPTFLSSDTFSEARVKAVEDLEAK